MGEGEWASAGVLSNRGVALGEKPDTDLLGVGDHAVIPVGHWLAAQRNVGLALVRDRTCLSATKEHHRLEADGFGLR